MRFRFGSPHRRSNRAAAHTDEAFHAMRVAPVPPPGYRHGRQGGSPKAEQFLFFGRPFGLSDWRRPVSSFLGPRWAVNKRVLFSGKFHKVNLRRFFAKSIDGGPPVCKYSFLLSLLLTDNGVWRGWVAAPNPGVFASCLRCRFFEKGGNVPVVSRPRG